MTLTSLVCICFQFAILFFVKDNISRYNFHFIGQLFELSSILLSVLALEDNNFTSLSGNLIKVLAFGKLLYLLTKEVEYFFTLCRLNVASQKTFITRIAIMFAIFIVWLHYCISGDFFGYGYKSLIFFLTLIFFYTIIYFISYFQKNLML
jgi:hypothetical protein